MADGAAQDPDRLPWLSDTRRPRRTGDFTPWLFWAFLAIVLVAGLAYWLGVKSVRQPADFADVLGRTPPVPADPLPPLTNEALPPAGERVEAPGLRDALPVTEATPVPIPGVDRARPAEPAAPVEPRPEAVVAEPEKPVAAPPVETATAVPPSQPVAPPRPAILQAWPADLSAGASGRAVRVGTFYSRQQAKQGWARIVRVYPGIRRLRAVVIPNQSLRNGQIYYRLQFGTTSQAHSAVLCQRMRVVGQSCVTVGLPASEGKPR